MTLRGARVLDLSTGIAGPYCTKLLADAGADVVKVEPPEGDPLRTWTAAGPGTAPGTGVLFEYLNTSKRSVLTTDPDLAELAAAADIIVADGAQPFPRRPHQVAVSISPFGLTGPWADRPATEFTLQAWCGSTCNRGRPQRRPVYAGGRLGEWVGGAYAAAAAACFRRGAVATGAGTLVDLSLFECMCLTMNTFTTVFASFLGWRKPPPGPVRTIETPSIEPTEDGYVGFCTITAQQFQDFLLLIERPDLLADEDLATANGRSRRLDEMFGIVRAWTATRQTDDIIKQASDLRIPVAPIGNGASVTGFDHFARRGVFGPAPARDHVQPRVPYRIHGTPTRQFRPAPALGADQGTVAWATQTAMTGTSGRPPRTTAGPGLPLAGLRIIDFTAFWAGPSATHFLAAMGADVIKIESVQRPDGMRFTSTAPPRVDRWWEWCPVFHGANGGKRSVTLDLGRPAGLDLVKRLIASADAVTENFSPRVMDNFGLGWDVVHQVNPAAIMIRMPAFGLDGPWRDRTGFAQNMEQVSGLAWVTGYADGPPIIPRGACDPLAGMHVVVALLAALDERERTGRGTLVEATAVEVALNVAAEQVLEYGAYGRLIGRDDNRGPVAAPQGVYASSDTEEWVAVAAATDAQWQALAGVLAGAGLADLSNRPDLATAAGRRAAHDELDGLLERWCGARAQQEAVATLLDAGVPAAAVVNPRDIASNPQLRTRAFFEPIDHQVTGRHDLPGLPFRATGHEGGWLRSPPPTLGEHNHEVLGGALGLDEETMATLAADAVIGTRPFGL
jgi:crotonobetainyl-CoA:carnitine CoA-transferase CaiB-like acyl-CoA transferase